MARFNPEELTLDEFDDEHDYFGDYYPINVRETPFIDDLPEIPGTPVPLAKK